MMALPIGYQRFINNNISKPKITRTFSDEYLPTLITNLELLMRIELTTFPPFGGMLLQAS